MPFIVLTIVGIYLVGQLYSLLLFYFNFTEVKILGFQLNSVVYAFYCFNYSGHLFSRAFIFLIVYCLLFFVI